MSKIWRDVASEVICLFIIWYLQVNMVPLVHCIFDYHILCYSKIYFLLLLQLIYESSLILLLLK